MILSAGITRHDRSTNFQATNKLPQTQSFQKPFLGESAAHSTSRSHPSAPVVQLPTAAIWPQNMPIQTLSNARKAATISRRCGGLPALMITCGFQILEATNLAWRCLSGASFMRVRLHHFIKISATPCWRALLKLIENKNVCRLHGYMCTWESHDPAVHTNLHFGESVPSCPLVMQKRRPSVVHPE